MEEGEGGKIIISQTARRCTSLKSSALSLAHTNIWADINWKLVKRALCAAWLKRGSDHKQLMQLCELTSWLKIFLCSFGAADQADGYAAHTVQFINLKKAGACVVCVTWNVTKRPLVAAHSVIFVSDDCFYLDSLLVNFSNYFTACIKKLCMLCPAML